MDSTPAVYASLEGLLAAAIRVAGPSALVTALWCALSLRAEALQVRPALDAGYSIAASFAASSASRPV